MFLYYNEVPDFNFGTAVSGQTKDLVDNTRPDEATSVDGNASGNLSVLESREIGEGKATGFNLTAQLGEFVDASGAALDGAGEFTLNLAALPISDGQNTITNAAGNKLMTTAQSLTSTVGSTTGAAKSVMSVSTADGTSYKDGEYRAQFLSADKAADGKAGASLKIADGISNSTAAVKSLNAPITWTLSTTPASVGA